MSREFIEALTDASRDKLMKLLRIQKFKPGEAVLLQEDTGTDVFFVLGGTARATLFSPDGKMVTYREIMAGTIFGEVAAIDDGPRSATVTAVRDLKVGRLARADFLRLIGEDAPFAWSLLRHLAAQSRGMTERIFEFSTMLVRDRLIGELLRLADGVDLVNGWVDVTPALTHHDLAARISTHREAVSREMSTLAKRSLISKRGNVLRINVERLRALRSET